MRNIKVIKNLPLQLFIRIENDGHIINFNDGEWSVDAQLKYQSVTGPAPFEVDYDVSPTGNALILELTEEQTGQLNHKGTGYILIVRAEKSDNTVSIRNAYQMQVVEDV